MNLMKLLSMNNFQKKKLLYIFLKIKIDSSKSFLKKIIITVIRLLNLKVSMSIQSSINFIEVCSHARI